MSETAILTAARGAVAAALPAARDWTDNPADPRADKLDAFVVSLERDGATPAAMGSDLEEVQLTVTVELFTTFPAGDDGRALAGGKGETIRQALRSDPALAALVDTITGATSTVDLAKGEARLARATVEVAVEATF